MIFEKSPVENYDDIFEKIKRTRQKINMINQPKPKIEKSFQNNDSFSTYYNEFNLENSALNNSIVPKGDNMN